MSRIGRQKDKYGTSNDISINNNHSGTAARTRPFSFEEIMLRRKNKKLMQDAKEEEEQRKLSRKDNAESASDRSESDGGYKQKKDSVLGVTNYVVEETSIKGSSRKKEENRSKNKDEFLKDNRSYDSEAKRKFNKDRGGTDKGVKSEKRSHHRSRNSDRLEYDDFENESEKKRSKDTVMKDKQGERDGNSQRESKRKHRSGNNEKNKSEIDGSTSKQRGSDRWKDTEYPEKKGRKKDSSQSHYEESMRKRRRSRSREPDRDRDRRSISTSPTEQKRSSYHGREHGGLSFPSFKDRSGRQHSDADKNRAPSNGGYTSGHYRRHASGLGGYSPRKRRTEAAVKTPSPTIRSPERKSAAWDLPPTGTTKLPEVVPSIELPTVSPATSIVVKPQTAASPSTTPTVKNVSIDSVQLTQATRPMRRLYVENLPALASEGAIMDCLNDLLLSSGVNYVQGTQPCISCIINKEKGQALVEFLSPEDATTALSFNGRSFSGSILKIRRPKDFVETATGAKLEKPVAAVDALSDVVKDSPHKIFIGGVSKALSSDMLMEIASAFGLLKAYHFEINKEINEPCAFLEYVDQSVTLKACAGLNGMKLGGKVLTVVQAVPDTPGEENTERQPFYGIPEHAKPLLEEPTEVLKLKNLFNEEDFSLLSEPELGEALEDIRLECARFGTVKSLNIIRHSSSYVVVPEALKITANSSVEGAEDSGGDTEKIKSSEELPNFSPKENGKAESLNDYAGEPQEMEEILDNVKVDDERDMHISERNESCEPLQLDSVATMEEPLPLDATEEQPPCLDENPDSQVGNSGASGTGDRLICGDPNPEEVDNEVQKAPVELNDSVAENSEVGDGDSKQQNFNLDVFESGCVLVEYLRTEAACMAAHCLHGRLYGDQVVVVGYVAHDLYLARFPR